jgi:hypothetical protein
MALARVQGPMSVGPFHSWTTATGEQWANFFRVEDRYVFRFPGLADFEVPHAGHAVACRPVPGTDERTCRHIFVNQVVPVLRSSRGELVFHASAAEVPGGAVAFLGPSGRGKSTIATSFARSVSAFLCDDAMMLEEDEMGFIVVPGEPRLRLWQDSASALAIDGGALRPAASYTAKLSFEADEATRTCQSPRRLLRAYFLGDSIVESPRVRALPAATAAMEWVRHSFVLPNGDTRVLAAHFDAVSRLASRVAAFRLDYPRRYDALPAVRQLARSPTSTESST